MSDGIRVNSESIRKLSKDLIDETNKLVQMIETARGMAEGSKAYFDSPAATQFRSKMDQYAENAKSGTSENLNNLANYFEEVAKVYDTQDQSIKQAEDELLSTDLFE